MAYHLRHGEYPPWLGGLAVDTASQLPAWVADETRLEYAPQGYDLPIEVHISYAVTPRAIEPATPTIWLGGKYARLVQSKGDTNGRYSSIDPFVLQPPAPNQRYTQVVITLPRDEDYPTSSGD
jgi:hypothetical protein